ncbi:MAG: helix-turn-helix transcriptional regulator [Spirochaetes bacterium]|nr:helix-turn-helix transcriptional regulator [Spirochaetota bacterium]
MNISFEQIRPIMDFFIVFEVSQACLLVFILLFMKRNKRANIFFALFIIILSVNFFSMFLHANQYNILGAILMLLSIPGISIIGVLIYFYTSLVTGTIKKFRIKHLTHFIIYLILLMISLISWHLLLTEPDRMIYFRSIALFLLGAGLINSLVYIIIIFMNLRNYYSRIENYFSDIEKYDMNWLKKLTTLSLLIFLLWNTEFWMSFMRIIKRNPVWMLINISLVTVIIFATAYYLINKPDTSRETREMLDELEEENIKTEREKYAKQNIDDIMKNDYLTRIRDYMLRNKPYLNENINIKELASGMNIPSHHLSIVLNDKLNKNFYSFINEYRIKEAINILEDPENYRANILSIAYNCGFNSKSTFNSVFKKFTGRTPSEYKNSLIKKSKFAS